ncbi:hypothetical protein AaE_013579, partial [Aphanomyces astaci]
MHTITAPPITTRKRLPSALAGNMWQVFHECAQLHSNAVAVSAISSTPSKPTSDSAPSHQLHGHTWADYAVHATAWRAAFSPCIFASATACCSKPDAILLHVHMSVVCTFVNMGVLGAGGVACHWRREPHEVQYIWNCMPFKWVVTDTAADLSFYLALPGLEGILVLTHNE